MGTSIWAADKSFDVGCKVIKWDSPGGFDFHPENCYVKHHLSYEQLKPVLKNFAIHWSVTYRARNTFNDLKVLGLSVNFIIDDDCNDDDCATIYQCLDLSQGGWSQGKEFNAIGVGVEISYMPEAWKNAGLYSRANQIKYDVPIHETIVAPIHGTNLRVFLPTQPQLKALYNLIWGYCELFPQVPPTFPRDPSGKLITTTLERPASYLGLVNHYHLKRAKIDAAGIDMEEIERQVKTRLKWGF